MRIDQSTKAKASSIRVFVKSLAPEGTLEEGEDLWEETDDAFTSGEEGEDSDESATSNEMFQRVTSMPNLISHTSLLTTMIHASMPQNVISCSTPTIRRPHILNGPFDSSPPRDVLQGLAQPLIKVTSNTDPPVLSTRCTRRDMFAQELTGSLRRGLLWEREVKKSTINAVSKRRHTAHKISGNSYSIYFNANLPDYHQRGW